MKVKELREKKLKEGHMKEIFQFIEENYGYSDYDQMIEDLVEEFGITEDEASSLLQDYNSMPDEEKRGMGVDLWGDEYGLCEESKMREYRNFHTKVRVNASYRGTFNIVSTADEKLAKISQYVKEKLNLGLIELSTNNKGEGDVWAEKLETFEVSYYYMNNGYNTSDDLSIDEKETYKETAELLQNTLLEAFNKSGIKCNNLHIDDDVNFIYDDVEDAIANHVEKSYEESKLKESEKIEYSNKKCGVKVVKYTDRFGDYFYAVLKDGSVTEPMDKQGNHRFIDFNDAMAYARSLCEEAKMKESKLCTVIYRQSGAQATNVDSAYENLKYQLEVKHENPRDWEVMMGYEYYEPANQFMKDYEAGKFEESKMKEAEIKEFEGLDVIPVSVEMVEQEIEEVEEGTATGTTWYEVALGYLPTGEVWKEKWIALGCNGVVVGQDSDDFGDLYDVKWHDYDVAELEDYITEPSQEAHDYAFEHSEPVVWGIYRMIDRCMENEGEPVNFEPLNESKLTEGNRVYKYTLKLTQPEGSRYHLTNQNTLKFKTREEAEERKEKILQYNKSSFEKKGLGIEVVEIEDKPRKPRKTANFENPFKEGDIIYSQVGWSMILPEWWEVKKVTPKGAICWELQDELVESDPYGQSGKKMPILNKYQRDYGYGSEHPEYHEARMVLGGSPSDPYLKYNNSYYRLWDKKPKTYDSYD